MIFPLARLGSLGPLRELSIFEIFSSLNEILMVFPVAFLAIGLAYCFFGRKFFDILNFLIGGFLALGFMAFIHAGSLILILLSAFGSFLIGGLIGLFVPYLLVGIVGFSLGLGLFIGLSPLFGLISGIVFAIASVLSFRLFLPALTGLIGGGLVGSAVLEWTGSELAALIVGTSLFVAGTLFQYFDLGSDLKGKVDRH